MEQKKTQVFGPRFNIFDFLIILALFVCVTAVIVRMIFIANTKEEVVFADVYFEITDISEVTANAICVANESVYLQSNDVRIGLVNTAESEPMKVLTDGGSGILVEAVHPDKKTVRGKAQIKGVWHEDGFMVEGTYLAAVGQTLDIYTKYASCTITVTAITEK